jgi:molybdopterin synthase sulfur carrier subunit
MSIKVIAFGQIAEITGKEMSIDAVDTNSLRLELNVQFPQLEGKKYGIAVNKKLVTNDVTLYEGDIVALMPPYSGG